MNARETLSDTSSDDVRLLEWTNIVLAHRFLIAALTIVAGAAACGVCKTVRPLFTAETTVLPNREAETRSLERMLNSNLTPMQYFDRFAATYVSSYYTELARSDSMLRPLAGRVWANNQTLATLFNLTEKPRATVADQALLTLRRQVIRIRQDNATGMLTIQCTTPDPVVSAEIANALVEGLKTLLKQNRTSGTSELVRSAQERTSEAQVALGRAEKSLQDFRMQNKSRTSDELKVREEQLQRDVRVQEEIFIRLRSLLAALQLGEQQPTNLINVIQPAEPPLRKSWPPTLATTLGAALFGFLLAISIAFLRHGIGRLAERDAPGYAEFERHIRSLNRLLPGIVLLLPFRSRTQTKASSPKSAMMDEAPRP